ncbi:hypothetical protein JCM8547_003959 [Rhodosporidiobolus lusitaniae]
MDHDTLKHFQTQQTLSKSQAQWTELLADYDHALSYVPGEQNILRNLESSPSFSNREGILYFEDARIVVPKIKALREALLHDAHDALGHLGPRKTMAALSA